MSTGEHIEGHHDEGHDSHGSVFKRIWVPFFILFGLTALEFFIAFTMPSSGLRVSLFVILTIVKAFYIVAYFMHLKFEKINLMYTIVLPFLFIIYLIILLLLEGGHIFSNLFPS